MFVDVLLLVTWMTLHPPSREVIKTEGTQVNNSNNEHEASTTKITNISANCPSEGFFFHHKFVSYSR